MNIARMSHARMIVTFVALLAFTCQGYLTQTHIHFPASIGTSEPKAAQNNAPPDKYPANQDPANCPICQEIAVAGHYVVPAATILALPSVAVIGFVVFAEVTTLVQAVSYFWQSRAPPKA